MGRCLVCGMGQSQCGDLKWDRFSLQQACPRNSELQREQWEMSAWLPFRDIINTKEIMIRLFFVPLNLLWVIKGAETRMSFPGLEAVSI